MMLVSQIKSCIQVIFLEVKEGGGGRMGVEGGGVWKGSTVPLPVMGEC